MLFRSDAARVATVQNLPGADRDVLGRARHRVVHQRVGDPRLALLLVEEAVVRAFGGAEESHFERADRPGLRPLADESDGEFASGQEAFDEYGLLEAVQQTAAGNIKFGGRSDDGGCRYSFAGTF